MFSSTLGDFSHVFGRSMRNNDHRKPIYAPLVRTNNDLLMTSDSRATPHRDSSKRPPWKWSESLPSRQKMLLNVPKHLRKQHSHLSSDFAHKMSLHAPYCTMKYPSITPGTM
ncbi:hypothetical protein AVEN_255757-1 [Araneus ventricosus]|uniref:Uncharacterized protein n=1 Tax=Araneus ventricosus TaxID=182803 RepID=A0A4Y2F634_ARAVE|nr:hypothetical protein AVEN_255757-1 [Araneus ventricosus]